MIPAARENDEWGLQPFLIVDIMKTLASIAVGTHILTGRLPRPLRQACALPMVQNTPNGGAADAAPQVPRSIGRPEDVVINALLRGKAER
jgi:hypothetical protein